MKISKNDFYKIYSNCRRGMLELDIILINFLKKNIKNLKQKEIEILKLLLNESDTNLYNWIVKDNYANKENFSQIIKKIKLSKNKIFNNNKENL